MTRAAPAARARPSPPPWLWAATVVWVTFCVVPLAGGFVASRVGLLTFLVFYAVKSSVECAAFVWAARRAALGARLRQALRLTAFAFSVSAVLALSDVLLELHVLPPPNEVADNALIFLTYVLGLAGMLWMPMFPARPGGWWKFVLDLVASVLGTGAVLLVLVTMPQWHAAPEAMRALIVTYGGAQVVVLLGMNTLVLRGIARPSARAFWLFIAALLGNVLTVTFAQFDTPSAIGVVTNLFVILTSLSTLWAADAFCHDPMSDGDLQPGPRWFASFNPLPLLATTGIAALVLRAALVGDAGALEPLAIVLVVQVSLLIARLFLTSRENTRLEREEAERQRRLHAEKMQAVGRLAGGMAHWYNNLLTTVIGHADMGAMEARGNATVAEDFAQIRAAADRAAALTHRLLSFSGRQLVRPVNVDAQAFLEQAMDRIAPTLPRRIEVRTAVDARGAILRADVDLIESVILELVNNAADAMPDGGALHVCAWQERVEVPPASAVLPVAEGTFLIVEVEDSGVGISKESLPSIFDPFFTTKPMHAAAGLGLAAVYGIVVAHQGGLAVRSAAGKGTTVRVYLPIARPASVDE